MNTRNAEAERLHRIHCRGCSECRTVIWHPLCPTCHPSGAVALKVGTYYMATCEHGQPTVGEVRP